METKKTFNVTGYFIHHSWSDEFSEVLASLDEAESQAAFDVAEEFASIRKYDWQRHKATAIPAGSLVASVYDLRCTVELSCRVAEDGVAEWEYDGEPLEFDPETDTVELVLFCEDYGLFAADDGDRPAIYEARNRDSEEVDEENADFRSRHKYNMAARTVE